MLSPDLLLWVISRKVTMFKKKKVMEDWGFTFFKIEKKNKGWREEKGRRLSVRGLGDEKWQVGEVISLYKN